MWSAFINTLPQALIVAVSPIPVAAIILVLMSRNGFAKSIYYLVGWFTGLTVLIGLAIGGIHTFDGPGRSGGASVVIPVVKTAFGLFVLAISFRCWRNRPKRGEDPGTPRWMESLDRAGPIKSMVFGALLGTLNLKNLPVTISAASHFTNHHLPIPQLVLTVTAFSLIGSIGVFAPVLIARYAGHRAERILQRWKQWLSENNALVLCGLFLLIGLTALLRGLNGLVH